MTSPLGTKIRKLGKEKGYTLKKLGALSGSSKSYIWELEYNDTLKPSAEKVALIASALGVTTDYLVDMDARVDVEDAADQAFYRKYCELDPVVKAKIRRLVELWSEE